MLLTVPHPVLACATNRETEAAAIIAAIVNTEIDVQEFDVGAMEPAFRDRFSAPIVKIGGRLWRRSAMDLEDLARHGLLAETIDIPRDTSCIFSDFALELQRHVGAHADILFPRPSLALKSDASGLDEGRRFLRKLGSLNHRKAFDVSEEDIEMWRGRMREFASAFCIVGGQTYEMAHEPMLLVRGHTITVGTSAIHSLHANRVSLDHHGLPRGNNDQLRHDIHVFPFGDEDAAIKMADEVSGIQGGADVRWFTVECDTTATPPETVLAREACRFATMHIARFDAVSLRWRNRWGAAQHSNLISDRSCSLGRYAVAAEDAKSAVRGFSKGSCDIVGIREALDELVSAAMETEQYNDTDLMCHQWDNLCGDSERHLARLDAAPVTLSPKPTWKT